MSKKKVRWVTVDTRNHTRNGQCVFDGFVHLLPRAQASLHLIDMNCWCDPRILWPEDLGTILVSHRNKSTAATESE